VDVPVVAAGRLESHVVNRHDRPFCVKIFRYDCPLKYFA
jgi:hypothetical protein